MESTWHFLVVRLARTPLPLTPDSERGIFQTYKVITYSLWTFMFFKLENTAL